MLAKVDYPNLAVQVAFGGQGSADDKEKAVGFPKMVKSKKLRKK